MRHRIAFCTTELRRGGAERCLVELAMRLDRQRFECSVVSLSPRPTDESRSLVPRLEAAGVPVTFLNARRATDAIGSLRQLTRHWRNNPPDLVQTFLYHANLLGRVAAARAGVPHIVSGIRVAEQRSKLRLWLDRWTASVVERHACVSEAVAKFSSEVGGLPRERLVVIPNGIDVAAYTNVAPAAPESLGVFAGRRYVVCIGRLDPQKGQLWLIEHARSWLDLLPEYDLVLVGDGPDRAAIESRVATLGLPARVHLPGFRSDVPAILKGADLLVLPSRWEGMPNVLLEAMAASRAVVAHDVEGVRELLRSEAQIAPDRDPQIFADKVVKILRDGRLRASMESANHERAAREFSIDAMVAAYERLYLELVLRQVKK